MTTSERAEQFDAERRRLFGLAYRMLGSVADADDVVQDAWLRFAPAGDVRNPAALLTTITTRLSIDRLRSARHRREVYVGPWLPEPLLTDRDPAHLVELDESIRLGFLHVLDLLSPVERAVFLLHDVFEVSYPDVAEMVERTEANCRQIAHRARARIRGERPATTLDVDETRPLLDAFLAALLSGDPSELGGILADDVVLTADGGASTRAARRPVVGTVRVGRFLANLARRGPSGISVVVVDLNGGPGIAVLLDDVPVMLVDIDLAGGRVGRINVVTNPDKLRAARRAWIAASGGDSESDPRISDPPRLVPVVIRDVVPG